MFGWLENLFGPEREGRRMARDARWIVTDLDAIYRPRDSARVAELTATKLADCRELVLTEPSRRSAVVRDVQRQHREARRRHDRVALSALTFVIIYLRCEALGEPGVPARQIIEEFLARSESPEA